MDERLRETTRITNERREQKGEPLLDVDKVINEFHALRSRSPDSLVAGDRGLHLSSLREAMQKPPPGSSIGLGPSSAPASTKKRPRKKPPDLAQPFSPCVPP